MVVLKDPHFEAFLKANYDVASKKLTRLQSKPFILLSKKQDQMVPWSDILLVIPILPLGQNQAEHKIDEPSFEQAAHQLAQTSFDAAQWNNFATYLTTHPANPAYRNLQPNDADFTWVKTMRLLRNIVAHENSLLWNGVQACLQQVIHYTGSRDNFRSLLVLYETHLIP